MQVLYVYGIGSFINHVDSLGGRGVSQMSTLLYNPYIVKWSTKGGGGVEKVQKTVYVVYERPPSANIMGDIVYFEPLIYVTKICLQKEGLYVKKIFQP